MEKTKSFRGRPRTTLPITLNEDLKSIGRELKTMDDLDELRDLAKRRGLWMRLVQRVAGTREP